MEFLSIENLISLVTLTALELVLGIDNIVFIIVVTGRLPATAQKSARRMGIGLAMVSRILLLLTISLIMRLTAPFLTVLGHNFSAKDLILLFGGLFLLAKATAEIHGKVEGGGHSPEHAVASKTTYANAVIQIMILDIIFSLDSVITAVGMAEYLSVMIAAVVIAVILMLIFTNAVSRFVLKHPTIQMLAFSFLLLVGIFLVAEGLGKHIDRGYIYFAMAFSLFVEMLNLRVRKSGSREPSNFPT